MNTCLETGDPLHCSRIQRDANGSLWQTPEGFVDNRNANIGSIKLRGVDVDLSYGRTFGRIGSLDFELLGTWVDRATYTGGGLAPTVTCAGAYGFSCGVPNPKWKHKARATWAFNELFSLSLQWRYIGDVRLDRSIPDNPNDVGPWRPGDERIGAQNYFDLTALARISKSYEIRLGVRNLFDREPPIVTGHDDELEGVCGSPACNGNTFPQVYEPLGRSFFAGVTIDLNPF